MKLKKKTYNPFTMSGSYIGAIMSIGLIITYAITKQSSNAILRMLSKASLFLIYPISTAYNFFLGKPFCQFAILAIYGFLAGYLIHSIIRRFRKK